MLTYADLLDHVLAYAGTDAGASASTRHRAAVQAAMKCIPGKHDWAYLWALGRVTTSEPYSTGTVEFDYTGGLYERMLTLTTGTWPDWAASGYVVIADVPYAVDERKSATVLTLTSAMNPGADVAAGTTYEIRRDQYALPTDFVALDEVVLNEIGSVLAYTHPREWSSQRRVNTGPGQPCSFSLIGASNSPGGMRMVLTPAPDAVYYIDFLYRRQPRQMVFADTHIGTASGADASSTITGSGTAFLSSHVGSIIRLGADNQDTPTGPRGNNPALYEGTITAYTSANSISVSPPLTQAFDAVKYQISDPADIEEVGMSEYLLRECERQFRLLSRMKPTVEEERAHALGFTQALEADSRFSGREAVKRHQSRRSGFDHYPISFLGG
ncbi:MAG TPA: hypothetical protein VMZ71_02240 [Gemmataceae bacterium]|nr:hypothetical protein [Gemmataceae bacterium]